jgi:two-component system, OmpR family, response regulator MprA
MGKLIWTDVCEVDGTELRLAGKRILVVDDDAGIQELLELALVGEGYDVLVARDGIDAFEKLRDIQPDLIVLDLMMPRMDGVTFARELRRRGYRIPIMVLTAASRGEQRALALDADGYVAKPFSLPEFLGQVARLAG